MFPYYCREKRMNDDCVAGMSNFNAVNYLCRKNSWNPAASKHKHLSCTASFEKLNLNKELEDISAALRSNYAVLLQTRTWAPLSLLWTLLFQSASDHLGCWAAGLHLVTGNVSRSVAGVWTQRQTDNLCTHELLSLPSEAPLQAKAGTICWLQLAFYLHTVGQLMEYYAE